MAKKRPPRDPEAEQLIFPFALRVGDVPVDEETRAEVVSPPRSGPAGKTTHAWVRRDGETVQRETSWKAWRKVRVFEEPPREFDHGGFADDVWSITRRNQSAIRYSDSRRSSRYARSCALVTAGIPGIYATL